MHHSFRVALATLLALSLAAGGARADWPEKPIRILIPWPAPNDPSTLIATAIAPVMSARLGVPVEVVNRPGGGAVPGAMDLAQARPDGYMMGLLSIGPMITQVIRGKTPYRTEDFQPLGLVWASPFTVAARADAPYSDLEELAAHAQDHEVRLAHWGLGTVPTLIALRAAEAGGFRFEETAYGQLGPHLLRQGEADVITLSIPAVREYVAAGELKLLATMTPNRLPAFPDTPTVAEQGFGEAYAIWFGAFLPTGVEEEIVQELSTAFFAAMEHPSVKQVIETTGVAPLDIGPEAARARMASEVRTFSRVMTRLGVIE